MEMSARPILLQARKPNGNPHQSWPATLLARQGDWIITRSAFGTAVRHHTKALDYYITEHSNIGTVRLLTFLPGWAF